MSIAFESSEVQLQKLRERLRMMSDEELVKFGKMVRGLTRGLMSREKLLAWPVSEGTHGATRVIGQINYSIPMANGLRV